jgi:predicted NBD/HSP70 family sugar kinase
MAKKRPGRGRPSSIDLLPEDIRLQLNAALRERRLTQKQILKAINPLLKERGEKTISRSAVNRYSMQIEEKGAMMREAREAADALVGGLGEQKGTDLGRAVTEMVKTLSFDLVVNGGELDVDTLNKVALIAQRIERASKISLEREADIRKQAREEAVKAIEESGKDKVMDAARIKELKEMFGL